MGPQPFGCGRHGDGGRGECLPTLQWGRNLSVAEGQFECYELTVERMLQWGRNLSVAEGALPLVRPPAPPTRFNGAATFRLRKAMLDCAREAFDDMLQWGRNLSVAEGFKH